LAQKRWELFPHLADIGVRGVGSSLAEAFEQAAVALTAVITDPQTVMPSVAVEISCNAPDQDLLFADWLNALIYEMSVRNLLFSRFEVTIADHSLRATAWGETVNPDKHQPAVEVKGATYTALQVRRTEEGGWMVQCVVDV
jgi:tRNA nucleotidyltransferase (CCA-adding enzyme)